MIPTYILHRNPDIFGENPDQFIPERFLNDGMKEQVDNFLFHAFGGGPRICIGMRFAMEEMKITLAKMLTNFVIIDEPNVTKLEFQNKIQHSGVSSMYFLWLVFSTMGFHLCFLVHPPK